MANQSSKAASSNIIQLPTLHNNNFKNYLTQYATANNLAMRGEEWEAALAAAQRLDYTGSRATAAKMEFIPKQESTGVLGRLVGLFRRTEAPVVISEMDDIRAFFRLAPEAAAQQSEINWQILRNGFGRGMIARLRRGGQQKGSRPTPSKLVKVVLWKELYKRKRLDRKTLYVRGHLLHHETGGPGIDFNWVILTAALHGDFGANHANLVHRYLVEGPLLWAYLNMHSDSPTISEIYYSVIADYNRPPRQETQELEQIAVAYKKAVSRFTS